MKLLKNMKIKTKLILAFVIVAFISGIVGLIGITRINKTNKDYTELYENYGVAIGDIGNVSISYQRLKINLDNLILYKNSSERNEYIDKINSYDNKIKENLILFEKSIQTEEAREEFDNLKKSLDKYNIIKDKIINLVNSKKEDEALVLMSQTTTKSLSDEINNSIDKLFELKINGGNNKVKEYSSEVNLSVGRIVILVVIAMIVAIILGITICRAICKAIGNLTEVTNEISNGNLDVKIVNDSKDEIGILSEAMKKMGYRLNQVLEQISFASEQVTVGSRQMADSTVALSRGATEQASAVEELTASIDAISTKIKMNAENTKRVNDIADNTKTNAIKRNSEMKLMLEAMNEINISSKNISKIIKVIDEIAFQTNILALNAAVEAARAGKYGKGFNVVAEEVRDLAQRSARAAKETTEIIEDSIVKIVDGSKIANQTAEALDNIVKDIEEVANIIGHISEASEEQSTGILQISQGVIQISEVVQSNSATAEESAASSEELAGQAEVLKEQVNMFNLKKNVNLNFYEEFNYKKASSINKQNNLKQDSKIKELKNTPIQELVPANRTNVNVGRIILSDDEFGKY
ncbi:methyl-accepting chemotaxis protein IV [Clostridium puniceum]|uniref:Methyl-accepting chemotaxis protein IV n=1 Tax=Clostridium puniceum TaxID=29367 RepID=A0A1S8TM39_9CLOT|nr:methyl-accepting chemotaxis protein [Clostridium puniceum]OOM78495.1 methyl-accepting chemotaxis protein IV [Clostridium puniceum]